MLGTRPHVGYSSSCWVHVLMLAVFLLYFLYQTILFQNAVPEVAPADIQMQRQIFNRRPVQVSHFSAARYL